MTQNIEIELRGPLTFDQYTALKTLLQSKASFKSEKDRVLIDYSTFLPGQGIRNRNKDIRARCTNGISEIVIKLGKWGGSQSRKELEAHIVEKGFDKVVQMMAAMGFEKGVLVHTKTKVYAYKDVEIALVEVHGKRYIFEAEIMSNKNNDKEQIMEKMKLVLEELCLKPYTDDEFFAYIDDINAHVVEVFDIANYKEDYFKERFDI
jgi:adenylate cyclase class IV